MQGIILAGGKSTRFKSDKALARIGEITLIEKAICLCYEIGLEPTVIARPDQDLHALSTSVQYDIIPEKGPLGGLYTACSLFNEDTLLVLTCDMPRLNAVFLRQLIGSHSNEYQVTILSTDPKTPQPFPGVYQTSTAPILEKRLQSNDLSIQSFLKDLESVQTVTLDVQDDVLANVNYREDLADLQPGSCAF